MRCFQVGFQNGLKGSVKENLPFLIDSKRLLVCRVCEYVETPPDCQEDPVKVCKTAPETSCREVPVVKCKENTKKSPCH